MKEKWNWDDPAFLARKCQVCGHAAQLHIGHLMDHHLVLSPVFEQQQSQTIAIQLESDLKQELSEARKEGKRLFVLATEKRK